MEEILHQLIGSLSHYFQVIFTSQAAQDASINSMSLYVVVLI